MKGSNSLLALAVSAFFSSASAQTATDEYLLKIERQPLVQLLNEFSKQTGLQVIGMIDANSAAGSAEVGPLIGQYTAEAAMNELLASTGLAFRLVNTHTIAVISPARSAVKNLDSGKAGSERPQRGYSFMPIENRRFADDAAPSAESGGPQSSTTSSASEIPDGEVPEGMEEVLVTGTNIRGGQPTGSKLIVIDRETIERSGHGRLQDVLGTLTQNFNSINDNYLGSADSANRTRGSTVQLRGLGIGTTLTLVNGQRQAMGGQRGAFVNISSIPVSAIERVEVLPDGASAIYGSDAIGGVVNIILRKEYSGQETRMRFSSADGDAEERQFAQLFGISGDKARVLVGYEFYERERLGAEARAYSASNDDLRAFGGRDYRQYSSNPGTIINPTTGQPVAAIPSGQDGTNLTAAQLLPGEVNYWDNVTFNTVLPWSRTHSAFLSASYDLSDNWEVFLQGRYGTRDIEVISSGSQGNITVPASNAFNRMGAPVTIAYDFTRDLGPTIQTGTTETYSATTGLSGRLGSWTLNVSAAYAQERDAFHAKNVVGANYTTFLASSNPAVALNLFGDGSYTNPATLDAIKTSNFETSTWKTSSAGVIASGPLFSIPMGDVKAALGGDYREEQFINDPNPTTHRDLQRSVSALFSEVAIPLLDSTDGSRRNRLELSLAGRYEDYDDFGTTFNPKVGLDWRPWSAMRLRGTWGTSFRAPPFFRSSTEFSALRARASFLTDPLSTAPNGQSQVITLTGNNPDIKEETAKVWTAGFDFSPAALEDLSLSFTFFNVDYEDKIIVPGPSSTILVEEHMWREAIARNPTQAQIAAICASPGYTGTCPTTVAAIIDMRPRNLAGLQVRGIDTDISYALPTNIGEWAFQLRGTYTLDYKTQVSETSPRFELVDTLENPLALRVSASASWSMASWAITATAHYADSYKNPGTTPVSKIDSWTTVDLGVSYHLDSDHGWLDKTRLSLSAVNLFDEEPPFVDHARNYGYDNANASLLGRLISAQVIKQW